MAASRPAGVSFADMEQCAQGDRSWLATPLGEHLLAAERRVAAEALDCVFGHYLLQVGRWGEPHGFLEYARTRRAVLVDEQPQPGVAMASRLEELAVCSDAVDAILLPHTLEHAESAHALLREVHRVLRPSGQLIVLGFNRSGPWGWRRRFSRGGFPAGCRRLISERRLRDWLALLNFRVAPAERFCYCPPTQRGVESGRIGAVERWSGRWLPGFNAAYLLVATKQVVPMTLVREPWRPRLEAVGGLEPTTRNCA